MNRWQTDLEHSLQLYRQQNSSTTTFATSKHFVQLIPTNTYPDTKMALTNTLNLRSIRAQPASNIDHIIKALRKYGAVVLKNLFTANSSRITHRGRPQ